MGRMFSRALLLWIAAASVLFGSDKKEIDVSASQEWIDTGVDLKAGDRINIKATGTVQYDDGARSTGPEGLARGWMDLIMQFPVNAAGRGALVARVGDSGAARAFLVGVATTKTVPIAGRLFLGINQMPAVPGEGAYHVAIERTAGVPAKTPAGPVPVFTQQVLEQIPARVNDAQGNLGDRVNFVVIGSLEAVQDALAAAGWVLVDKTRKDAVLTGLLRSLSKEAYVSMPMSELELFGRVQDFGYAQADPLMVVAERHHFRIWKAPFTASGETVWAGAGTHDIGFEKDQRNNGLTHKIDPATDAERDYIGQSLEQSGMVVKNEYLTSARTVKEARTATGGGFTSDGRTLIIYLQSNARN
ncbi:MAG TPA: LssY C-terminal domain-containing protein [Bryobacteraceae bacterium]|nr:LssY C-terminal domain-containing protein [Bryobacteraceae bacterium]